MGNNTSRVDSVVLTKFHLGSLKLSQVVYTGPDAQGARAADVARVLRVS